MPSGKRGVLFLCTGNSARSILAEAILEREGGERFRSYSAGSHPKGRVHPRATALLGELGFETGELRSKSWNEFAGPGAPELDFIITVCGDAAGEVCPVWPGKPITAHWGLPDPAAVEGPEQREAFLRAYHALRRRVALFLALPFDDMDPETLVARIREIGRLEPEQALG